MKNLIQATSGFSLKKLIKKYRVSLKSKKRTADDKKIVDDKTLEDKQDKRVKELQAKMFLGQRALFRQKKRLVLLFEGMDAAGKGGSIRKITELLDPRGFQVYPIGPPEEWESKRHWLYRFWTKVPEPGVIAIFDRSWYGRVLVEKVELGLSDEKVKQAYRSINDFERTLNEEGVCIIKIFIALSKEEQLVRFEQRLADPHKQWKLQESDIKSRKHFDKYLKAVELMFKKTSTEYSPWNLVLGDSKGAARVAILELITGHLKNEIEWIEDNSKIEAEKNKIMQELKKIK